MLDKKQRTRIARRCSAAMLEAITAFPSILARTEPEQAAVVVADLIKFQLSIPVDESSGDPLEAIIAKCMNDDDDE